MKLSFSSLGAPEWSVDEILAYAKQYGYDGVGFRGVKGQMDHTKVPEFLPEARAATLRRFREAGVEIMMMLSGARLAVADGAERERHLAEARANIDLAADLDAKAIRVFGGKTPQGVGREAAARWVVEGLRALGDYAAGKGVRVLLESHDDYTDTYLLRELMQRVDHPWVGVLWDVHHPYRSLGQSMREAWDNIGRWTYDTHFKDSVSDPSDPLGHRYTLLGEGDVPVLEALRLLKDAGYSGYLTFEWEKVWHPELPDAHVAFPHYAARMREYLRQLE